jgi:hypothetical protein
MTTATVADQLSDTSSPEPSEDPTAPDDSTSTEGTGSEPDGDSTTSSTTIQPSPQPEVAASLMEVAMTTATVADQLSDNNLLIRKHGTQLMAIADYVTPVPDAWFGAAGSDGVTLPNTLPVGYFNMGYITTDGIGVSDSVSASTVAMVQDIEPVRSDIDSIAKTLKVVFGEASSWTHSLASGLPCSQWPEDKTGAYEVHYGDKSAFPYYRIFILTQDGIGADAVYRVEYAYRAMVTDIADRTLNRTDAETIGRTFTCFRDPAVGRSYTTASTGLIVPSSGGASSGSSGS